MADELMVVFENAPGPEPARFVEVENATMGGSVEIKWHNYGDPDRWELGPFVKYEHASALEVKVARLEGLLARAYPFLTWPDEIRGADRSLDAEFDGIVRDVEVAIQHLPDDKEI